MVSNLTPRQGLLGDVSYRARLHADWRGQGDKAPSLLGPTMTRSNPKMGYLVHPRVTDTEVLLPPSPFTFGLFEYFILLEHALLTTRCAILYGP